MKKFFLFCLTLFVATFVSYGQTNIDEKKLLSDTIKVSNIKEPPIKNIVENNQTNKNTDNDEYEGLTYNPDKKVWVGEKYSRVKEPEKVYNTGTKHKYKYKYWRNGRWNYRY